MERPSVLEDADVLVHSSTREDPENELTINARDPALGVYWPRLDDVREAITSDEDGAAVAGARSIRGHGAGGDLLTLVPIRTRPRGERRSLRTFPPVVSLRPPLARFQSPPATPFNSV
jgi:hypothetical protein